MIIEIEQDNYVSIVLVVSWLVKMHELLNFTI